MQAGLKFIFQGLMVPAKSVYNHPQNLFVQNAVIVGLTLVLGNVTRYFSLPCDLQNSPEEIRNVYLYATG